MIVTSPFVVDEVPDVWTPVVVVDDEPVEDDDEFEDVEDDDDDVDPPVTLFDVDDDPLLPTTHCVPLKTYPGKHEKQYPR